MSEEPNQDPDDSGVDEEGMPLWVKIFGGSFLLLVLVVIVLHLMGRGMGGHG